MLRGGDNPGLAPVEHGGGDPALPERRTDHQRIEPLSKSDDIIPGPGGQLPEVVNRIEDVLQVGQPVLHLLAGLGCIVPGYLVEHLLVPHPQGMDEGPDGAGVRAVHDLFGDRDELVGDPPLCRDHHRDLIIAQEVAFHDVDHLRDAVCVSNGCSAKFH
jgi:hypothetical protein